jgi:hypothetical protein
VHWPIGYNPPRPPPPTLFDEKDQIKMRTIIALVHTEAHLALTNDQIANGCVVVEPISGRLLASAFDRRTMPCMTAFHFPSLNPSIALLDWIVSLVRVCSGYVSW